MKGILLVTLLGFSPLDIGINLAKHQEYELSLPLLNKVERQVPKTRIAEFYFYKGLCQHQLGLAKESKLSLTNIIDSFEPVPFRYKNLAYALRNDLDNWNNSELLPISRKMQGVGRRLELGKGGPETQRQQKEILAMLDKLISEKEKSLSLQLKKGKPGEDDDTIPIQIQGSGQGNPASDSQIMGGNGKGKVDEKRLRSYADRWGTLPEAERAKAIQEITRDLPTRYKREIEDYFKSLNRK